MARRARAKPKSPDQILAERNQRRVPGFEAVSLQPEMAQLPRNLDIEVTRAGDKREGRRVQEDSARRLDAFLALRDGMRPGAYDAARRMERDIMTRRGEGDRGKPTERVDGDEALKDHTDQMVDAGRRLDKLKDKLSDREWWLLHELIAPSIERDGWREIVAHITGEDQPNAQGAVVRSACANLAEAYDKLDRVVRKAA
jgi:hypothetical protein